MPKPPTNTSDKDDAASEAINIKKDLALQRLLKESHLLDSHASFLPSGKNRHKALDLRLQDIGSKTSIYAQRNMPMSHRKGIAMKAANKERIRRRVAQENGIILEKPSAAKTRNNTRRVRGVGGPSVGKFRNGTLTLSKKDIAEIRGPEKRRRGKR